MNDSKKFSSQCASKLATLSIRWSQNATNDIRSEQRRHYYDSLHVIQPFVLCTYTTNMHGYKPIKTKQLYITLLLLLLLLLLTFNFQCLFC